MLSTYPGLFDELTLRGDERGLVRLELPGRKLPDPSVRDIAVLPEQAHSILRIDSHYRGAPRVTDDFQLGPISIRQHDLIGSDRDDAAAKVKSLFLGFHRSREWHTHPGAPRHCAVTPTRVSSPPAPLAVTKDTLMRTALLVAFSSLVLLATAAPAASALTLTAPSGPAAQSAETVPPVRLAQSTTAATPAPSAAQTTHATHSTRPASSTPAPLPDVDIPYKKYILPNGLTLIVHEDHKAPLVAVDVWYHVGSKDERPGRTGFAHLFEHLMFNGSENHNDEFMRPLLAAGATALNGNTWLDRTTYFENVPVNALDLALWLESDRMGHLVGAIDQKKLDEQRGVVQNEKRQRENQPYGKVDNLTAAATYPTGHPYSWTTIGSMEDLNAASLADVKDWFKTYYGAANAVLVVAGDVPPRRYKSPRRALFWRHPARSRVESRPELDRENDR